MNKSFSLFKLALASVLGLTAAVFVSCGGGAKSTAVADSSEVKVMTFNIRYANPDDGPNFWDNRRESVVKMIQAEKPDVMGIQEGLVQQVGYLDSALTNYSYVGVGRDDGKTAGEHAAIYFNKDRFEVMDSGNFWLNETPDQPVMGWDAVCIRIATWVRLKEKTTGKEMMVFNTHFDHIGKIARQESAKLLLSRVHQVGDSIPTLIMGDLNYPTSDPSLAPLVNAPTFVEVRKAAEVYPQGDALPSRTFQGFRERKPQEERLPDSPADADYEGEPIDHIFAQNFRVLEYRVVTDGYGVPFLSDHYPVAAVLKY